TILVLAIPFVAQRQIGGIYLVFLVLVFLASFEAVQPLAPALQSLGRTLVSGQRVLTVLDSTPAVVPGDVAPARETSSHAESATTGSPKPTGPRPVALQFDGVSFSYAIDALQHAAALTDISLSVPPGSRLAIVGPSGAGKSTLVRLALRFHEPT